MKKHEATAKNFIKALKELANNEAKLENFEAYLEHHFEEWLKKFANTPEGITSEFEAFANIKF